MLQPVDIRKSRKAHGLSLRELGRKAGVSHSTISRIENGKVSPTLDTLNKLNSALTLPKLITYFDFPAGRYKNVLLVEKKSDIRGNGLILELFKTADGQEVIIIGREQ